MIAVADSPPTKKEKSYETNLCGCHNGYSKGNILEYLQAKWKRRKPFLLIAGRSAKASQAPS
jgi:hypothetical protein